LNRRNAPGPSNRPGQALGTAGIFDGRDEGLDVPVGLSRPELSIELVGQVSIPGPASLPERKHEAATEFGGSFNVLPDGGAEAVAGELEGVIVGAGSALQQVDDSRSVAAVYGRPQGGSLLL
jgi:hypothetical protein